MQWEVHARELNQLIDDTMTHDNEVKKRTEVIFKEIVQAKPETDGVVSSVSSYTL